MQQVAQLSDDRQTMEVTMEQLQLENDTIGECGADGGVGVVEPISVYES